MKGVIHRDIKPHNILINEKTGVVKITDFGISVILTHENDEVYNPDFIVGTMAYMSPEQARGEALDTRTDLFSLGVVLYEMSTGQPPFTGGDQVSILAAILRDTPQPCERRNHEPQCLERWP